MPAVERATTEHVMARLDLVAARVERAVLRRRGVDPQPDDRFRGLYLTDVFVDHLLADNRPPLHDASLSHLLEPIEQRADEAETDGEFLRLRQMASSFGLTDLETEIVLIGLAPDVDPRFEWLYGYLNDDVTRRRATVGFGAAACRCRTAFG